MEVFERKIGRIFRMEFSKGENLLAELANFARQQGIKEASLFVVGAMGDGEIVTGFRSTKEGDSDLRRLGEKREFFGLGNLIWPKKRPSTMTRQGVPWNEPQPYPHLHLSFGPDVGEEQKGTLVGHLDKGLTVGVTVILYELLS